MYLTDTIERYNRGSDRLAGRSAASSGDEAKPAALCFGSQQDALDYAAHCVDDANRRLVAQSLDAVDRYRKGEVAGYVGIRSRRNGYQCHLVFCRIPTPDIALRVDSIADCSAIGDNGGKISDGIGDLEGNEGAVFLGVTELVQSPESVIPSLVWAESQKQRCDFRRAILGDLPTVNVVVEAGRVASERKTGSFGIDLSANDGASVSGLVENGAQIVGDVEKDAGQALREILRELDFVNIPIRLVIDKVGPTLIARELSEAGIEFTDVMLCAIKGQPRAVEGISHGRQIRSDEGPRVSTSAQKHAEHTSEASFGNEARQALPQNSQKADRGESSEVQPIGQTPPPLLASTCERN
jgi:hypothetical protein